MTEPNLISEHDEKILREWQHAYVRYENALLFNIEIDGVFPEYLQVLMRLPTFEDPELRLLGQEANLPIDGSLTVHEIEVRQHAAMQKLLQISIKLVGDLFPDVSKKIH